MLPINKVIINKETNINPIWIMRQAGRYLPEFREIRSKNPDFIKLCLNEKLSAEITLQPLKRFNLDAAIIFSDILILPYGCNQKVEFKKNFGPMLGDLNLDDKLDIIGMNYKDNLKNAENFLKELGNPYKEIFIDLDGTIAIEWGAYGVPESFLIYNNEIIKKYIGPLNQELVNEINLLIK